MKKLKKLKLNQLSQTDLTEQEMRVLVGGGTPGTCNCGCGYAGTPGGSTSPTNSSFNNAKGITDSYGYDGGGDSPWGPGYVDNNTAMGDPCNPARDNPCWGWNGNFC